MGCQNSVPLQISPFVTSIRLWVPETQFAVSNRHPHAPEASSARPLSVSGTDTIENCISPADLYFPVLEPGFCTPHADHEAGRSVMGSEGNPRMGDVSGPFLDEVDGVGPVCALSR